MIGNDNDHNNKKKSGFLKNLRIFCCSQNSSKKKK